MSTIQINNKATSDGLRDSVKRERALRAYNVRVSLFNRYNSLLGLRAVRMLAFEALRRDERDNKHVEYLYGLFKDKFPHWFNGHIPVWQEMVKECRMVLERLSKYDPISIDAVFPNYYATVSEKCISMVNVRMGKMAATPRTTSSGKGPKTYDKYCRVHPYEKNVSHGLCAMCAQRVNRFNKAGYIDEATDPKVVDRVLSLPNFRKRYWRDIAISMLEDHMESKEYKKRKDVLKKVEKYAN